MVHTKKQNKNVTDPPGRGGTTEAHILTLVYKRGIIMRERPRSRSREGYNAGTQA